MMIHTASTDSTITLWWDQPEGSPADAVYAVRMDGREVWRGDRTHCTVTGLAPETKCGFRVEMNGEEIGLTDVVTRAVPRRLNVTDFGAKGDGKALNTAALQAAIDACGDGEEVFVPAGVFLTGALRLHSRMNLQVAEGAVLQEPTIRRIICPRSGAGLKARRWNAVRAC